MPDAQAVKEPRDRMRVVRDLLDLLRSPTTVNPAALAEVIAVTEQVCGHDAASLARDMLTELQRTSPGVAPVPPPDPCPDLPELDIDAIARTCGAYRVPPARLAEDWSDHVPPKGG